MTTGGAPVPIIYGGTGSSTASAARTALGLAIGTDVQAYDATLQSLSALGTAAAKTAITTGVDTWAEADFIQNTTLTNVVAVAGTIDVGAGTYTYRVGRYAKVGEIVFFWIGLAWTAHTGTGNMIVTGLPYTSRTLTNIFYTQQAWFSNITMAVLSTQLGAYIGSNSTTIVFADLTPSAASSTTVLDAAGTLLISGSYTTAS